MKNLKKDNKGFSLVELLVVIAIMVVLVGVLAPTLLGNIEKSRVSKDVQSLDAVAAAIQSALGDEKAWDAASTGFGSAHKVSELFTAGTTDQFALMVQEYLAKEPTMSGKDAKAATNVMYYGVTDKGQVIVWLATADWGTAAIPTAAGTNILNAKNTDYIVVR